MLYVVLRHPPVGTHGSCVRFFYMGIGRKRGVDEAEFRNLLRLSEFRNIFVLHVTYFNIINYICYGSILRL